MHMPNGFLNGMGWVINQEERGWLVVGNGVSMRIVSICKGRKNLIKVINMFFFLKVWILLVGDWVQFVKNGVFSEALMYVYGEEEPCAYTWLISLIELMLKV